MPEEGSTASETAASSAGSAEASRAVVPTLFGVAREAAASKSRRRLGSGGGGGSLVTVTTVDVAEVVTLPSSSAAALVDEIRRSGCGRRLRPATGLDFDAQRSGARESLKLRRSSGTERAAATGRGGCGLDKQNDADTKDVLALPTAERILFLGNGSFTLRFKKAIESATAR